MYRLSEQNLAGMCSSEKYSFVRFARMWVQAQLAQLRQGEVAPEGWFVLHGALLGMLQENNRAELYVGVRHLYSWLSSKCSFNNFGRYVWMSRTGEDHVRLY